MADGASYEISIMANATGVDASASQVNALAGALQNTAGPATQFDSALQAATAQLASASSATASATAALSEAQSTYKELQVAADRAAKAVEKASVAGKDTTDLRAKADAAAAAMRTQAAAVDQAAAAAKKAAAAEKELADSVKTIESAQKSALSEQAREPEVMKRALGPMGEKIERLKAMKDSFGIGGTAAIGAAAAWVMAAVALVAVATAAATAVFELAKFAVTSNPKAMAAYNKEVEKAQKGIKSLFKDVRVGGFISATKEVLSVFQEGSAEAEGMKALVETLLNPLFDAAQAIGPYVKEMFRGMIWAALEAATAVVQLRNAILRAIPKEYRAALEAIVAQVPWLQVAFYGGAVAAAALAVAIGLLVAVVVLGALVIGVLLVASIIMVMAPFLLMVAVIAIVVAAIYGIGLAVQAAGEYLAGLASSAADAASNLVSSFVSQIQAGVGMVADAMRSLGSSAIGALKSALGIASPSKFALAMASNVTETFSGAIEDDTSTVQGAMSGMVPDVAPASAGQAAEGSGAKAITLHIKVNDGPTQTVKAQLDGLVTLLLEGDAIQIGAT